MILLDTDHATLLKYPAGTLRDRLRERLDRLPHEETVAVTIVTVEEQMRGWLACLAKERTTQRQVAPYRELARLFEFYSQFTIIPFDDRAAIQFDALRSATIRIGTMDLKIASIAMVNQCVLLSANLRDFVKVPGLRVENWLE